jgi:hypothetical protein
MGFFHLLQAVIMAFLATSVIQTISEFKPQITQFYLSYNTQTQSLEQVSKNLFELPFGMMVALFLFISAVAHALISLPNGLNKIYNADLERGINKFR